MDTKQLIDSILKEIEQAKSAIKQKDMLLSEEKALTDSLKAKIIKLEKENEDLKRDKILIIDELKNSANSLNNIVEKYSVEVVKQPEIANEPESNTSYDNLLDEDDDFYNLTKAFESLNDVLYDVVNEPINTDNITVEQFSENDTTDKQFKADDISVEQISANDIMEEPINTNDNVDDEYMLSQNEIKSEDNIVQKEVEYDIKPLEHEESESFADFVATSASILPHGNNSSIEDTATKENNSQNVDSEQARRKGLIDILKNNSKI